MALLSFGKDKQTVSTEETQTTDAELRQEERQSQQTTGTSTTAGRTTQETAQEQKTRQEQAQQSQQRGSQTSRTLGQEQEDVLKELLSKLSADFESGGLTGQASELANVLTTRAEGTKERILDESAPIFEKAQRDIGLQTERLSTQLAGQAGSSLNTFVQGATAEAEAQGITDLAALQAQTNLAAEQAETESFNSAFSALSTLSGVQREELASILNLGDLLKGVTTEAETSQTGSTQTFNDAITEALSGVTGTTEQQTSTEQLLTALSELFQDTSQEVVSVGNTKTKKTGFNFSFGS